MLLNRSPSWRQGSRGQPVDQAQDLSEQRGGDSNLCELECEVAAMPHDLSTNRNSLLPQRVQNRLLAFLCQQNQVPLRINSGSSPNSSRLTGVDP